MSVSQVSTNNICLICQHETLPEDDLISCPTRCLNAENGGVRYHSKCLDRWAFIGIRSHEEMVEKSRCLNCRTPIPKDLLPSVIRGANKVKRILQLGKGISVVGIGGSLVSGYMSVFRPEKFSSKVPNYILFPVLIYLVKKCWEGYLMANRIQTSMERERQQRLQGLGS